MAIDEHDREDLLNEATQFSARIMLQFEPQPTPDRISAESENQRPTITASDCQHIFIGRRLDGAVSVYFDVEPVFQFNRDVELRRLYFEGHKYAALKRRLYRLVREHRGGRVQARRVLATPEELASIRQAWRIRLQQLRQAAGSLDRTMVGMHPQEASPAWLIEWIEGCPVELEIAARPNAS